MLSANARVVKWQTRTFEGRMPQGMGVQVPPRALFLFPLKTSVDAVFMRVPEDLLQQISRTAYTPLCPQICIQKYQKMGRQNI